MLADIRVLAHCEQCPKPVFSEWAFRTLSLAKESDIDLEAEDPTSAAFYAYHKLCKLGRKLNEKKLSREDLTAALDYLKQYYSEFLPSNERLLAFTNCGDLATLEEHLELYSTPIHLDLERDRVHPIQKLVKYY